MTTSIRPDHGAQPHGLLQTFRDHPVLTLDLGGAHLVLEANTEGVAYLAALAEAALTVAADVEHYIDETEAG